MSNISFLVVQVDSSAGLLVRFASERFILATISWIVSKFCTDVHGPQRLNPTDFDFLAFYLVPQTGQNLLFSNIQRA